MALIDYSVNPPQDYYTAHYNPRHNASTIMSYTCPYGRLIDIIKINITKQILR
jgi:hypothetical protein